MKGNDIMIEAGEDSELCAYMYMFVHLGDVMIIHVQVLLKVQDKLYIMKDHNVVAYVF